MTTLPGFGTRLKESIERSQLDPAEIAVRARIDRRTLDRYGERDDPPNRPANVEAVAEVLGVSPEWLSTGEGTATPVSRSNAVRRRGADDDQAPTNGLDDYLAAAASRGIVPGGQPDPRLEPLLLVVEGPDGRAIIGYTPSGRTVQLGEPIRARVSQAAPATPGQPRPE